MHMDSDLQVEKSKEIGFEMVWGFLWMLLHEPVPCRLPSQRVSLCHCGIALGFQKQTSQSPSNQALNTEDRDSSQTDASQRTGASSVPDFGAEIAERTAEIGSPDWIRGYSLFKICCIV